MQINIRKVEQKTVFKNIDKNIIWLFVLFIGIFVMVSFTNTKGFLSVTNFQSMTYQFPEFGIMALGMMICMVAGGIDLSVVGIANLTGIIAASIIKTMEAPGVLFLVIAVIVAFAAGALCGLLNGFLIGYLRIPAMLVTLCGLQIYTGLGLAITKGPAITGIPESFQQIGNGLLFNTVPISLLIFIGITALLWYALKYTKFGQQIYMMGANPVASQYSGINNLTVTIKTHILSGILATVSGIIICSHYGSAKSDYGSSYTLLTLLIVILGGINPSGGKGKIAGVVLAILILQILSSVFNIWRLDAFFKTFIFGLVLVAVMILEYRQVTGIRTTRKNLSKGAVR